MSKITEARPLGEWHNAADIARIAELEQQLSRYHNLLAVAHRDGGQYLARHGEEKAGEAAITAILTAYHNNDRYQGGVEVEGEVVPYSDVVRWQGTIDLQLPEKMIGKRVRALVKEVE